MEPILKIDVELDEVYEVIGTTGRVSMLLFHGSCDCDNFHGKILPGGVDTQKEPLDKGRSLSARYILEGTDRDGNRCHIFVENNKAAGDDTTKPVIYTDSRCLKWLETADLYGIVEGKPGGVIISFCENLT